jgi:uncharacterized protein YbaR (Trm112 family)
MLIKQILDALACPAPDCRGLLTLAQDEQSLRCTACGRIYPVRDGIPVLRTDQAEQSK